MIEVEIEEMTVVVKEVEIESQVETEILNLKGSR